MTLSLPVSPTPTGVEVFVHGVAGRVMLLPDGDHTAVAAHAVAVDELSAAALTGGEHPCGVGFALEVVAVLAAAEQALASGGGCGSRTDPLLSAARRAKLAG